MAVGVADEATEARLHPNLWGFVRFRGAKKTQLESMMDDEEQKVLKEKDIEDIFDDIETGL